MIPDKTFDIFDDVTNPGINPSAALEGQFDNECLILVKRKNKVILSFSPQKRNITLGRSRKNSIVLPDPRFPRQAGEIILGPVPHYRNADKGNDLKTPTPPTPMSPEKEYPFPPYKVRLMEPGGILVNRAATNKRPRRTFIRLTAAIILTTVIWSTATWYKREGDAPKPSTHIGPTEVAEEMATDTLQDDSVPKINGEVGLKELQPEEARLAQGIDSINLSQPAVHGRIPIKSYDSRKLLSIVTENAQDPMDNLSGGFQPDGIPIIEFEGILSTVKTLLEDDQLDEAFRVVNPIAPLSSKEQRVKILETIDPHLQKAFRKAYMLKNIERAESIYILEDIVACRLEFLPTWQKAKKLLDKCRVTSTQ
jgi:hypothetical protein